MRATFRKSERIVRSKVIESLFEGGSSQSVAAFPLRAVYRFSTRQPDDDSVQLLISVPKKRFHHAVDRNRVKRQLREAFRHHKALLYQSLPDNECLLLAFVWLSDKHFTTKEIDSRVVTLMHRIGEKLGVRG